MQQPFQCVATVCPPATGSDVHYLIAACGPKLQSVSLTSGDIVSHWSASEVVEPKSISSPTNDNDERPTKKLKTAPSDQLSKNIIKLTISPNNQHVLVVTDDKSLHVLSVNDAGTLAHLSSRSMPKRPCAIEVLPNNSTILVGDKFGDVYSLPLLVNDTANGNPDATSTTEETVTQPKQVEKKPFQPSATTKTVHTQRNLRALAAQQNQKNLTPKSKEPLAFEHKLLLGHVSMLTDLAYAQQEVDGKARGHVITADRDEHVRVSRGPPQSHIIEGYCLGHKDFISKICPIPGTTLLLSGGGDDWIGVWDWSECKLRRKLSVQAVFQTESIAISGLWFGESDIGGVVFATSEKSHRLAVLPASEILNHNTGDDVWSWGSFDHPILDVSFVSSQVLISQDARIENKERIQAFRLTHGSTPQRGAVLVGSASLNDKLKHLNQTQSLSGNDTALDELLYGVEKLRKRGYADEAAEE